MFKTCNSNGVKIAYQDRGAGSEPLLLLMGLGASSRKWEPHIEAYEKHFRIIAPDNRGAGTSDKPETEVYTIREMAEDALAALDAEHIGAAHVNGISMGGAIGLYLAIHHPERVKSLILTNAFSRCSASFRKCIEFLRDSRGEMDGATLGHILQWLIYSSSFQETNEAYLRSVDENDPDRDCPVPDHAFKAQCNGILGFDASGELSKVKASVLIAAGELDLFVPPWFVAEMANAMPQAELYMCSGGGHVQHWEQLDAYNARTLEFLLKHSGK